MDGWSTADVIGAVGGLVGLMGVIVTWALGAKSLRVSRASVQVSEEAKEEARRSADAGERSAVAAENANQAGERSADAAQESARQAAEVARMEREREHDRLSPGPVPHMNVELESNPRGASLPRTLFGVVSVPRDYRVRAEAVIEGGGHTALGLPLLLHAGRSYRFTIEQWPPGRMNPQVEFVLFRFWVPVEEIDKVAGWDCPCDRPMIDGSDRGHWEWRAPIQYELAAAPAIY
ncbi:hypothetical protein V6U89_24425 [Micromonospora sp. CPCC 206171]|uniref:hypothetical protein n=1 Tax=Micromonospora sp. CPCC 206171 TaxID=3122405 RepID=UPI002FEEE1D6